MMWLLLVALVIVVVVALAYAGRQQHPADDSSDSVVLRVSVETKEVPAEPAVPQVTPASGNVLQPFSPIPLTVVDASPEAVSQLRRVLDDERTYGRDRREQILAWLLKTNGHVREIDSFIAEWGGKYRAAVKTLCEADADWATAGELDREDIRGVAANKAVEQLDVRVTELKYDIISEPPRLPATADDALLERYGFETLSFYFRNAYDLACVHSVPSDDWYRPRFESLVAKGLAKRGTDVALEGVLGTLTLKDMEALAEGVEHKRFTRRAPAIQFLTSLPDLQERLGKHVSLRELFQLAPLPAEFSGIDLEALGHSWAFAAEYAMLLDVTHWVGARAQRAVSGASAEYSKGWVVESSYGEVPSCPCCARQAGEFRDTRRAPPRLPHHVGCTCSLSEIYD